MFKNIKNLAIMTALIGIFNISSINVNAQLQEAFYYTSVISTENCSTTYYADGTEYTDYRFLDNVNNTTYWERNTIFSPTIQQSTGMLTEFIVEYYPNWVDDYLGGEITATMNYSPYSTYFAYYINSHVNVAENCASLNYTNSNGDDIVEYYNYTLNVNPMKLPQFPVLILISLNGGDNNEEVVIYYQVTYGAIYVNIAPPGPGYWTVDIHCYDWWPW